MRQSEGLIHDKIIKRIDVMQKEGIPIYAERRSAQGLSFKKGRPDMFIIYNGIHIEVEEKTKDGSRSVMQEKWEEKCRRLGIEYMLVSSVEDFESQIKKRSGI